MIGDADDGSAAVWVVAMIGTLGEWSSWDMFGCSYFHGDDIEALGKVGTRQGVLAADTDVEVAFTGE